MITGSNCKRLNDFYAKHLKLIENRVALKKYLWKIKNKGLRKIPYLYAKIF